MTEPAATMLLHGALVGAALFVAMRFLLQQPTQVALDRSAVAALLVAAYMIVFGHRFPPAGVTASFRAGGAGAGSGSG